VTDLQKREAYGRESLGSITLTKFLANDKNKLVFQCSGVVERGKKMKHRSEIMQNLLLLSQFGLSLAAPLLLCLFLCQHLVSVRHVGEWVYIPGFFFGLGASFTTAWKLYQSVMNRTKRDEEDKETRVASNEHR